MSQIVDYRFFDSEPVTLLFGDDCKPLYVQEGILTKIPFFEKALRFKEAAQNEAPQEPKAKSIDLKDCDAKAVADVIHYVIRDDIPQIKLSPEGETNDNKDSGLQHRLMLYTNAWIIADKFGAEKTANTLIDRIVKASDQWILNPSLVGILVQHDLEDSHLCKFLIQDIAYQILRKCYGNNIDETHWESYAADTRGGVASKRQEFRIICEELPSNILARVLYASQVNNTCPTPEALKNPCTLHKHEMTEPCLNKNK